MSGFAARGLYDRVREQCVDRLREAFVQDEALFARQLTDGRWQPTTSQEAITSSAIALIGLSRAGIELDRVGVDSEAALASIFRAVPRQPYHGAVGLGLWANAVWDGLPADRALAAMRLDFDDLQGRLDAMTTMEVAWLLSGLVHELRRTADDGRIRGAAEATADHLTARRHEPTGLFRHSSPQAPWRLPRPDVGGKFR